MQCPKCGSQHVSSQTFQEQQGSVTHTKFRFKAGEKHHGCLWWLVIGWWWWIFEFTLWLVFFPFMCILRLFRSKKYRGKGSSVSTTVNKIGYVTLHTCQDCGNQWKVNA